MCAEKEEYVEKGDNLLKYTNGTFITAPYNCVILDYSVPNAKSSCTSTNYISTASVENLYMDINIGEEEIDNIAVGTDGTTSNITVETGISNDAYIEIKSGITENTNVQVDSSDDSASGGMQQMME